MHASRIHRRPRHPVAAALLVLLALLVAASGTSAADADAARAAELAATLRLQGEYRATIGDGTRIGIHVAAVGSRRFRATILPGGLPGEPGWSRTTIGPIEGRADRKGTLGAAPIAFGVDGGWRLTLSEGGLAGTTDGGVAFAAERVERDSPTAGEKPPPGAVVLFDGTGTDAWKNAVVDAEGFLQGGATSVRAFGDQRLHVEFRLPFEPDKGGEFRGNSGVYLLNRYEIQITDAFGFGIDPRGGSCGGIYGLRPPDVNANLPPLRWQTFDVVFTAPRFGPDRARTAAARMTVRLNGVTIHDDIALDGYKKGESATGPLLVQKHGHPVAFRNIWLVEGAAP